MNKQIEEMARYIDKSDILCRTCGESTYTYCADAISELLYNAGYRRQDEVAKEIFAEIERNIFEIITPYNQSLQCLSEGCIDELKKKYGETEE